MEENLKRVHEFGVAFGCHQAPEPWTPALTPGDRAALAHYHTVLAAMARRLKVEAEHANGLGRTDLGLLLVRLQLHIEENAELVGAWVVEDLVEVLDALCDQSYVVDGTVLMHGLGSIKTDADQAVHDSNMSKLGADGKPIIHGSGRVVKGPNYVSPKEQLKHLLGQ